MQPVRFYFRVERSRGVRGQENIRYPGSVRFGLRRRKGARQSSLQGEVELRAGTLQRQRSLRQGLLVLRQATAGATAGRTNVRNGKIVRRSENRRRWQRRSKEGEAGRQAQLRHLQELRRVHNDGGGTQLAGEVFGIAAGAAQEQESGDQGERHASRKGEFELTISLSTRINFLAARKEAFLKLSIVHCNYKVLYFRFIIFMLIDVKCQCYKLLIVKSSLINCSLEIFSTQTFVRCI